MKRGAIGRNETVYQPHQFTTPRVLVLFGCFYKNMRHHKIVPRKYCRLYYTSTEFKITEYNETFSICHTLKSLQNNIQLISNKATENYVNKPFPGVKTVKSRLRLLMLICFDVSHERCKWWGNVYLHFAKAVERKGQY